MSKLSLILSITATLVSFSAHADRSFVCTTSQTTRVENLKVKGSGQSATVNLDDDLYIGDYTFNAYINGQATDDLDGTSEYLDLGFLGKITDKSTGTQFPGAFFVSPSVLAGSDGTIYLWTGSAMTSFNCK